MSLLDFLTYRQAKRIDESQTAWQRYRELLQRFASGEEIDSTEADLILEQAGKSEADLQSDVALLEQRIQWAEQLDGASEAEHDRALAELEIHRMVAEVEALQAKHAPKMQEHRNRIAQCDSILTQSQFAKSNLVGSVIDPQLSARIDSLNGELRLLHGDKREAEEALSGCNLSYWRTSLEGARENRERLSTFDETGHRHWHGKIREYQNGLDNAEAIAKRHQAEIDALAKRIAAIQAELAECHDQMLQP